MASQGLWNYNDALANFNSGAQSRAAIAARLYDAGGEGGAALQPGEALPTHLSRTWNDILRDNAYQMVGQPALTMSPAQWEQIARSNGILGGIENTPGEIFKDGMNNGLGLLLTMVGGMAMQGAGAAGSAAGSSAGGSGAAAGGSAAGGASEGAGALYAGGGEVGSGYAASSPGFGAGTGNLPAWAQSSNYGTSGPSSVIGTDGVARSATPGLFGSYSAPASGVSMAGDPLLAAGGFAGGGAAVGGVGGSSSPTNMGSPSTPPPATTDWGSILTNPKVLGAGAGALLGSMGGTEQAGTTTTEEGLPEWLKQYAKPALDRYGTELQNYNIDPYGVMSSAGREYKNTLDGMYLDPASNKYLTDYFNTGAERVKGTLSPSFGHMQAFGSHTGYNEALAGGLADLATGIYGGNYQQERDRQAALTAGAPNFIGTASQAAFSPYQSYLDTISKLGKSKQQPYFNNPFGSILGGASLGFGLGDIFSPKKA